MFLIKKLAYPYEHSNETQNYQKPVDNLKKEYFISKLKNICPNDGKTERTKQIFKLFNITNGEEIKHEN